MRPRLLDAFACEGGAGHGYALAGWDVEGVDIIRRPRNPYRLHVADAIGFIREHGREYDAVHASPPCQFGTDCQRIRGNHHPNLIPATRAALQELGVPYVIENVPGAREHLLDPVLLCGAMFPGLRVYRHRYFEANWPLTAPAHPAHVAPQAKMGRPPGPGEWVQPVGNFSGVAFAREAMGMPWASRDGLREAIPPAYTEWIGAQMLAGMGLADAA